MNTRIGVAELCRKYAVNPVIFYAWKERFISCLLEELGPAPCATSSLLIRLVSLTRNRS
ncbi:hypothetical protein KEJ39_05170 [Candidatus Bathyarchaeota archaeon]|nr:hypothetical protein [Candidatus Bathyarchaeota archaeon]